MRCPAGVLRSTPAERKRRPLSRSFSLRSHGLGRWDTSDNRRALGEPIPELGQRRSLCDAADLPEKLVVQGQTFHGRARLQPAVEVTGTVRVLVHPEQVAK